MKCILFNSPIYRERFAVKEDYLPPLGLGYIATSLENCGINAEIVDCVKEHLGIDEIFELLKKQVPDFMGINIFTQNYDIVKDIVEQCPIETAIIIGGQVVKCIYEDILKWNVCNKLEIVIGEGELILPELINGICSSPPVINKGNKTVYRVDKFSSYFPEDLDSIPLNRKMLKEDTVINHYGRKEAAIITSRGCMYNCAFCGGAHNLNQDVTIRYRSIDAIEKEIKEIIKENPDISCIRVLDDLFLRDLKSINNAVLLFTKFPQLYWRGMAHILTFLKSIEMLPLLKQSGCCEVFIGIESGSERIRKKINKPGAVKQVIDVIYAILNAGIDVKGYFMYGFPGETDDDADQTYSLIARLIDISSKTSGNFRSSVFQFRPYHGTKLYKEIVESGHEIASISSNKNLNVLDGRAQFNFQSGNYSDIDDNKLDDYILKSQNYSEVTND